MLAQVLLRSPLHKNLSMYVVGFFWGGVGGLGLGQGVYICTRENWYFTPILHLMFAMTFPIVCTEKVLQKKSTSAHLFGQCSVWVWVLTQHYYMYA